jgi:hypothetical protein
MPNIFIFFPLPWIYHTHTHTHTQIYHGKTRRMLVTITVTISVTGHLSWVVSIATFFSTHSVFPSLSTSTSTGCGSLPVMDDPNLHS